VALYGGNKRRFGQTCGDGDLKLRLGRDGYAGKRKDTTSNRATSLDVDWVAGACTQGRKAKKG
jgi:hypothetical protein